MVTVKSFLYLLVIGLLHSCVATPVEVNPDSLFEPTSCRQSCRTAYNIASNLRANFTFNLANTESTKTTASTWAVALLSSVRAAVGTPPNPAAGQTVTITPPAVAKLLGGYSIAVYQAFAVYSKFLYTSGRYFQPLSADMVNLVDPSRAAQWKSLEEPFADVFPGNFAPEDVEAIAAQTAAISGAASKFISLFFCYDESKLRVWCREARRFIAAAKEDDSVELAIGKFPTPYLQGEDIAAMVFDQLRLANVIKDTITTLKAAITNKNISGIADRQPTQFPTTAVHNCAAVVNDVWNWRTLTTPAPALIYKPDESRTAVFPPQVWPPPGFNSGNQTYRGYASTINTVALVGTKEANSTLLADMNGPPIGQQQDRVLRRALRQVLQTSATLDDRKKVIAEFWADGPESTTPPGHWYKIAFEESAVDNALSIPGLNKLDRGMWASLLVGVSLHEAGYYSWKLKADFMGVRPITGIQCLLGYNSTTQFNGRKAGLAWRGPYMGVGRRDLSKWQPFQNITFVTPAFPGYVSGHATFSAAAAEALRLIRSGQNTTFANPTYNCYLSPEGFSQVEPKIVQGTNANNSRVEFVEGLTNVPNTGPRTRGYSPARDVVLCWKTYDDAAKQAAASRLYGGIHIDIDNKDGLIVGKRIGATVVNSLSGLSPANYKSKEEVVGRNNTVPTGYRKLKTPEQDLVCPPGTFVRAWDMRFDVGVQLHALGLTCSDGTYISSAGLYSKGRAVAVVTAEADGFYSLQVSVRIIDGLDIVVGVAFTDRDMISTPNATQSHRFFGGVGELNETTMCFREQRIVGLATRSADLTGKLGSFHVLCGKAEVQDAVIREREVPADPVTKLWRYDNLCPLGLYITSFFGKEGTYVNTITAQCSQTWNLKTVGVPGLAEEGAKYYSDTAAGGYIGIRVRNGSGNADAISFIPVSGPESRFYGNPNLLGAGPATPLLCDHESRVVGIFGWQDAYVASIGIICSPGEFDPLPASIQEVQMKRNVAGSLVIPGDGVVAQRVSDIVPLSVLPVAPIPTIVSGVLAMPQPVDVTASKVVSAVDATNAGGAVVASSADGAVDAHDTGGVHNASLGHLAGAANLSVPSEQDDSLVAHIGPANDTTA